MIVIVHALFLLQRMRMNLTHCSLHFGLLAISCNELRRPLIVVIKTQLFILIYTFYFMYYHFHFQQAQKWEWEVALEFRIKSIDLLHQHQVNNNVTDWIRFRMTMQNRIKDFFLFLRFTSRRTLHNKFVD